MIKYVKCVDGLYASLGIIVGQVYMVDGMFDMCGAPTKDDKETHIYTLNKKQGAYYSSYFESTKCPCNVKNCLKHTKKR